MIFRAPNESYSQVQEFISDIIFFTGSCYSCGTPCEECNKLNLREVAIRVSMPCFNNAKYSIIAL